MFDVVRAVSGVGRASSSLRSTARARRPGDALYRRFGAWIAAATAARPSLPRTRSSPRRAADGRSTSAGAAVDRIVIMEDQTRGQLILSFAVSAVDADGNERQLLAGTSVGRKRIDLFDQNVTSTVRFSVFSTAESLAPAIRSVALFRPCPAE